MCILPDRTVERTAHLVQLSRRDAVILFDHRRYKDDKAAIAQIVRDAGGKVVVFTDAWLSPAGCRPSGVRSASGGVWPRRS
ncbi:SIS domain-containing protein [Streptomyces sp. A1136]|uniref:SIS domain-containing protein n=1 Tax=Streptomyces sp. A1136 TaxID=2563102 RepID=UPI001F10BE08|nr:SIS domain-containing protein [Streptomyces sp. A1136]